MNVKAFGKVIVLLGGRAGLGGAERGCGKAKLPPSSKSLEGESATWM